jgi:hypothetical protein
MEVKVNVEKYLEQVFYPPSISKSLNGFRLTDLTMRSDKYDICFNMSRLKWDILKENAWSERASMIHHMDFIFCLSNYHDQIDYMWEIYLYRSRLEKLESNGKAILGLRNPISIELIEKDINWFEFTLSDARDCVSINNPHPLTYVDMGNVYFKCSRSQRDKLEDSPASSFHSNEEYFYFSPLYDLEFVTFTRQAMKHKDFRIVSDNWIEYEIDPNNKHYYLIISEQEYNEERRIVENDISYTSYGPL